MFHIEKATPNNAIVNRVSVWCITQACTRLVNIDLRPWRPFVERAIDATLGKTSSCATANGTDTRTRREYNNNRAYIPK